MDHATQVRLLKALMQQIENDTNTDAGQVVQSPMSAYTCKNLAAKEWQTFFKDHAQIIGMSGDLPQSGSFMTLEDWGVPVLATRDNEGQFRAFLNTCRHRGAQVENERRGTKRVFTCPYHAWSYGNDGSLRGLPKPEHFGDVDKSCNGLVELPAQEKHGFLWVHPDPKGQFDATDVMGPLAQEFDSWNFGALDCVHTDRYECDFNWKLAMETFGETYHFDYLHKNTLAPAFYGHRNPYEKMGQHHRMVLCLRSIDELSDKPESEWDIRMGGAPVYFLFPNVVVNVVLGGVVLVRTYPIESDPTRSVSELSFYYDQAALEKRNAQNDVTPFQSFSRVVEMEDYVVATQTQKSANAGLSEYSIFGRNEAPLHHYHNVWRTALGMPELEARH